MTQRNPWIIPKIWEGETAFIIGGGPSVKAVDINALKGKYPVIACNMAFVDYPWVDVLYFGDCDFYRVLAFDKIRAWSGLKVTCCTIVPPQGKGWPNIRRVGRSKEKPEGLETETNGFVAWNSNTGASAINLAYWLGVKKVVLIGFDMKPELNRHNYHEYYPNRKKGFNPYKRHLKGFSVIKEDAKRVGLEIINSTKNSALTEFEYTPFERFI